MKGSIDMSISCYIQVQDWRFVLLIYFVIENNHLIQGMILNYLCIKWNWVKCKVETIHSNQLRHVDMVLFIQFGPNHPKFQTNMIIDH